MQNVLAGLLLCVFVLPAAGATSSTEPNSSDNLFKLSLEELMEVPIVESSSRQRQRINEASAAMSIVTAEDIHYSGLTNVAEILQFEPGIDIVKFNRTLYGVGVHGMHETLSNHVVSLVDGRYANNPLFGGSEFHKLPLFLEDIERIEIVRGPGGAAWGANAFTGVINIITKDPKDTLGYFASSTITEFGDSFTHLRWGAKQGDWRWRVSAGYEGVMSSKDAGAGKFTQACPDAAAVAMGYSNFAARDFSRNYKFDIKMVYEPSATTKMTIGTGYSHLLYGDFEMSGNILRQNNRSELIKSFVKIDHEFTDGSTGYLQWFGNFSNFNWVNAGYFSSVENDIEAQLNFAPIGDHHISIGGNFRWDDSIARSDKLGGYTYHGSPYNERWAGFFAIDRWEATDRLTLEAQVRTDYYSEVTTDWSNRFTALYDIDGTKKHILRMSVAKAFRSPLMSLRKLEAHTMPLDAIGFPGFYGINGNVPDDLKNEETWSAEIGYTGKLTRHTTLSVNTFYQRMDNLIGYVDVADGGAPGDTYVAKNIAGADSYGAEVELAYEDSKKKLSVWYAYESFQPDQEGQHLRSFLPVEDKFGITGRLFMADGWTFNANYKFNGVTPKNPLIAADTSLDSYHRLDLTLSKKIAKGNGEIMIGVSDVFNKTTQAVSETATNSGHTTPGRTFFARFQMNF
jgi:iron complex outermembrane receptor protein